MMSQKQKRILFGVVGLGNIADFHARAAQGLVGGGLHACYSRNPEKAAAFARKYGCIAYSDYTAFLADPKLDVVSIATPSGAHLDPAVAAAKAGKHVVVEKPLEVTPERCQAIIDTCARKRVKLVTIFPSRFKDVTRLMKQAMDEKRIGKPVSGSAFIRWYRDQAYYDSGAWRGTWALDGGGCLMNQGIHAVDLLIHLMGDPVEVFAYSSRPSRKRIEVETHLVASLKFKNGALGVIEASTEMYAGYPKSLWISGTEGTMSVEEDDLLHWHFAKPKRSDKSVLAKFAAKAEASGGAGDPLAISHEGHQRQFQELVDVLRGKKAKLSCAGKEGMRSVKLICAIYESARTGKTIRLG
ncbi:MAG: UDP-N-acetyl-2-amino-2-deoxyglucuronate dehydrogenase [Kiritimatiellia bacterium]|jgi:UDP-N-acetyl-2-amino-2-deoxyglucuronate dehydrogenase